MRIGIGYDIHRLVSGRKLILGGIEIPYDKGLLGHSDGDALVHALCDALLGAACFGDLGLHFPDNDPEYKNIYSLKLLSKTYKMISDKKFSIINIDSIIFAEKPKLASFHNKIKKKISEAVHISSNNVNIKATTTERLGIIGHSQAIGAECIVLLE